MMEHFGEDIGDFKVVVLGVTRRPHPHLIGVPFDDSDDFPTTNDRNCPDINRDACRQFVIAGFTHLGAHKGLGDQTLVVISDRLTDDVVFQSSRASIWTHLGNGPEHVRVPIGNPQDEVGERRIGKHLPVVDEVLEPGDIGVVETSPVGDDAVKGRHAVTLVTEINPAPAGSEISKNE